MSREDILPIDKGWAWVVVAAACGLFALHAGGFKCQGVLLVELTEKYEGVYLPSTLIWIFTIKYIITGMIGPLVSLAIVKLRHRVAGYIGISLMVVSYVGLAYSYNFTTMILFHSIPGGIGNGMMALVSLLVSNQYFKRRKALALGIIASGSGIGTITIPYILRPLFDNLTFNEASMLYGGFCMQFLILVTLLRPMSYYEQIHAAELIALENFSKEEPSLPISGADITLVQQSDEHMTAQVGRDRSVSFNHQRLRKPHQSSMMFKSESHLQNLQVSNKLSPKDVDSSHKLHIISAGDLSGSVVFFKEENSSSHESEVEGNSPGVPVDRFHWRVILMPKFLMIGISMFVYAMGTCVIYAGIPALAKESGSSKYTVAIMMTVAGGLEVMCRIANGYIADRKFMTATNQYTLSLFVAGFMALLCALISGLPGIALALIGMSSVGTSIFSLLPVVFLELVGAKNVTTSMGMQLSFQSTAFIVSSSITGVIYDIFGSWREVYFYIAAMMMLGSCVTAPYCIYQLWQKHHYKKKLSADDEVKEMLQLESNNNQSNNVTSTTKVSIAQVS